MVPLSQLLEMQRRLKDMTIERNLYKHIVDTLTVAPVRAEEAPTADDRHVA